MDLGCCLKSEKAAPYVFCVILVSSTINIVEFSQKEISSQIRKQHLGRFHILKTSWENQRKNIPASYAVLRENANLIEMYRGNLCKKLFTWSNSFHTNGPQFFSSWSQIRFWLETLIFSRESQVQPAYQLSSKSNSVFVRVMLKDFKVLPRWWLPTCQRFIYKLSVLTYNAFHIGQPYYLADLHVIDLFRPSRCLSSTNCYLLAVPPCAKSSFVSRAFCVLEFCPSAYRLIWQSCYF